MLSERSSQIKTLYLFGDQTFALQPHLGKLLQHRSTHPLLASFLQKAFQVIYSQLPELPERTRNQFTTRLTSAEELLNWRQEPDDDGNRCIAVDMAIACTLQAAHLIMAHSEDEGWSNAHAHILGFCTGSLTAAAASCSNTIHNFIPLALEAIGLAFRTGRLVTEVSLSNISAPDTLAQSCAVAVLGSDAAKALHTFLESKPNFSSHMAPYIMAYPPRGISVTGPPASLAYLEASAVFRDFELKPLPIYGLYHNTQLYSPSDLKALVETIQDKSILQARRLTPVISGAGSYGGDDFGTLVSQALSQILFEPLRWGSVLNMMQSWCIETSVNANESAMAKQPAASTLHIEAFGSKAGLAFSKWSGLDCSLVESPE